MPLQQKNFYTGIGLATLAALIWSGNFIIARGVIHKIPPVTLSFYRWLIASVVIFFFARRYVVKEFSLVTGNWLYFLATAATGVSIFNTFVYIGGHYSEAINLALIGTTSSPIMSVLLARIFLKERITPLRIAGMLVCISGILMLLSKGRWDNLLHLSFSKGDWWVLAAAFSFSVYNTLVKKRPAAINPVHFLFVVFAMGTLILVPFYVYEWQTQGGFAFSVDNILVLLYLGIFASVICFLIWNKAIIKIGAGRTALFGNLIPVFSTIEAVFILGEKITWVHLAGFGLVLLGLLLANSDKRNQ